MLKQLAVATALSCGAAVAFAQTTPPPSPTTPMPRSNTATAPAVESTGDFNKAGEMAGSALIGAKVHDAKKETVGSIQDVYLDDGGKVEIVIVSVGGFLGVGAKDVAVKWEDINKFGKDGKSLALTTDLTKDALKAMPDYKSERQKSAAANGG
jgi:sporulation protein YlmC with PRC-barrel domain